MVHQSYITRLVLGRSAFEVPEGSPSRTQSADGDIIQQYDSRGYPENNESRQQARRLRRAQNDILTTIGVCVSVDDQTGRKLQQGSSAEATKEELDQAAVNYDEHSLGFWVELGEGLTFSFLTEWVVYVRRRIQTFDYHLGVPLLAIVQADYQTINPWTFFLAGKIPFLLWRISGDLVDLVLEWSSRFLPRSLQYTKLPKSRHVFVQRATFVLLSPLYMTSKLQQLGLVSDWCSPLSAYTTGLSTITGGPLTRSWTDITYGFFTSSFPLILAYLITGERLERRMYCYSRAFFGRPDNPSSQSYRFEGKGSELDASDLPVLMLPETQPTLKEEIKRDWQIIVANMNELNQFLKSLFYGKKNSSSSTRTARGRTESNQVTFANADGTDDPVRVISPTPSFELQHQYISSTPVGSPPQSPRSSASEPLSEVNPAAVQVRTRSGSTSTLHMDLEVHLPMTAQQLRGDWVRTNDGDPIPEGEREGTSGDATREEIAADNEQNSTDSAAPARERRTHPQRHRVTALTILPAQELAGQIGVICTAALMFPFETSVLRSIARAFLDTHLPLASAVALRQSVYQPPGQNLAKYGWAGLASYGGNIALCFGLETVLALGAWRLASGAVLWYGKRRFGWGKL